MTEHEPHRLAKVDLDFGLVDGEGHPVDGALAALQARFAQASDVR
jgi:hypothetical protein